VAEQGFPGFEMTQWYGMLAPASLPQAHADKLSAAAAQAVRDPAAVKLLESEAAQAIGSNAAEFARFIEQEKLRWKPVIARAKIKPD
jgi:tripartite-type tricarboxylate transporter receptor subunit TctC